jgi:hypothetical protein
MTGWNELKEEICEIKYDHFSFDFWSTIAFSNPKFKLERSKLVSRLISNVNSEQKVDNTFLKIGKEYNDAVESNGIINKPELLYRRVLKELDICESNLYSIQCSIEDLFRKYPPIISSGFLSFYKHISQMNSTKSITSNTAFISGEIIVEVLEQNLPEVTFDFKLFSDQIGCAKPSTEIYNLLKNNVYNLHNENSQIRILHIGDNESTDFEGSIKNGLSAVLISKDNCNV